MSFYYHNGTCRLCGSSETLKFGPPIKYSVRHYAHAGCGLDKWGAGFFDRLSVTALRNFPYFAAKAKGLDADLVKRLEAEETRLDRQAHDFGERP